MGQILPPLHQAAIREVGAGHPGQGGRVPGVGARLQAQGTSRGGGVRIPIPFLHSLSVKEVKSALTL